MTSFYKIKKCRICGSKNLKDIIDLKKQHIQGSFVKKNAPKPYLRKIPLVLKLCLNCSLVQLSHTTNKEVLYKNYWYESAINSTMKFHLKQIAKISSNLLLCNKNRDFKILDIGCNDGTLLKFYSNKFEKFGIDPSQIIEKINDRRIKVIRDFFPPQKKKNFKFKKKFDLITSIAMFYDLDDPNLFVKKIKFHLKKNGIWIFELSYLIDMLKLNSFDTICHEHLEYYSLHSLEFLMKKHNLKIFKITKNTINGGSIRCFVTHKNNNTYDNKKDIKIYDKMISNEKKMKIKKKIIYRKFFFAIKRIKNNLLQKILKLKKDKKKIFILGASTKGNTILQYLGINEKIIPFAIERNREKVGASTIGSNIKIISESFASQNSPDYKLVLPWHFKSEIIRRELNFIKKGGKLIFPLPNILTVDKKNYLKHV